MDYYGLSLLIASMLTGVRCDQLTPRQNEVFDSVGSFVPLSYTLSKPAAVNDYFFWYRQYPGKPPEFLISHTGTGTKLQDPVPGFSFNVTADKTQMDLLISSAAVTDSAVYYCALQPFTGNRILFGTGTSLTIETKEEIEPDYYDLGPNGDGTTVCLATGFTRLKATMREPGFQNQSASQITDLKGEPTGFYSQVAFQKDGGKCGDSNKEPVQCDAELEPDEMVNLASITIFGLRIIFIKTVAFNVLMTLRLWISQ